MAKPSKLSMGRALGVVSSALVAFGAFSYSPVSDIIEGPTTEMQSTPADVASSDIAKGSDITKGTAKAIDDSTQSAKTESPRPVPPYSGPLAKATNNAPSETELPGRFGDDEYLDRLWQGCQDGSGQACEALFQAAPVGSEYERFGVSCGDRAGVIDCQTQLVEGEVLDFGRVGSPTPAANSSELGAEPADG